MRKLYYSLHNHSCLSPCADNDNTPNNLLGMATLSGINVMALTDHNSTKNCPAFFEAAKRYDVIPIAGMELTTSEDIHVVFLFYELDDSLRFGEFVDRHRTLIRNRPDIFGEQLILDGDDNVIGKEEHLLSNATTISVEDVPELAERFRAVCFPAHIDRAANSIVAILGTIPEHLSFSCVEIHNKDNIPSYKEKYIPKGAVVLVDSDAHYLTDLDDAEFFIEVDSDDTPSVLREKFLNSLR